MQKVHDENGTEITTIVYFSVINVETKYSKSLNRN